MGQHKVSADLDIETRLRIVDRYVKAHWLEMGLSKSKREDWGKRLLPYGLDDIEAAMEVLVRKRLDYCPMWPAVAAALDAVTAEVVEDDEVAQRLSQGSRDVADRKRREEQRDAEAAKFLEIFDALSTSMKEHLRAEALELVPQVVHIPAAVRMLMKADLKKKLDSGEWSEELIAAAREEEIEANDA